jgi:hypothetical protein
MNFEVLNQHFGMTSWALRGAHVAGGFVSASNELPLQEGFFVSPCPPIYP